MSHSHTHHRINQLQQQSTTKTLESVLVFLAALFVTVFLPSILIKYLYADQQLMAQPATLEYIPIISFAVAMIHFVYTMAMNMARANKIKQLEAESDTMNDATTEAELAELESLVNDVLEEDEMEAAAAAMPVQKTRKVSKKRKTTRK